MSATLRAFAPAKLNLGLEVLRRRPDGYHDLETIFQALDWGDELEFSKSPTGKGLSLEIAGGGLVDEPSNTVRLAYEQLRRACPGRVGAVAVRLEKRIPVGSGLGGGSSDAAATLVALDRLFRLELDPERLGELALAVGSDVPFFLLGGTALGRGRGEELRALPPLSQGAFLLIEPGFSIRSAWAFEQLRLGLTRHSYRISVEQVKVYLSRFPDSGMVLVNRLEDVVFPAYPVFEEITEGLKRNGAVHALMSGSGSTVFGSFPDRESAERAGGSLSEKWRVRVVGPRSRGVGIR